HCCPDRLRTTPCDDCTTGGGTLDCGADPPTHVSGTLSYSTDCVHIDSGTLHLYSSGSAAFDIDIDYSGSLFAYGTFSSWVDCNDGADTQCLCCDPSDLGCDGCCTIYNAGGGPDDGCCHASAQAPCGETQPDPCNNPSGLRFAFDFYCTSGNDNPDDDGWYI